MSLRVCHVPGDHPYVRHVMTGIGEWGVQHVADRADGAMKADAVGVALEIDRLRSRLPGRRTV